MVGVIEMVEEGGAGALEKRAEGEVFGELVDGRDEVEIWCGWVGRFVSQADG